MRTAFGEKFDVPPGYLNTASLGIPTVTTANAVAASVSRWAAGQADAPDYDLPVRQARTAFAELIGVPVERVASGSGVSPLVAQVAAGVPDGARVLVAEGEFTSVSFPFAAQAARGVTVTAAPLDRLAERAADFDLVAVAVVQSADGAVVDLDGLRASGARVLLDVSQSLGWFPQDLAWADWVVGAGYKWLLAPRGSAWLAVRPEAADWTLPVAANWYAGDDPWKTVYDLPLRLAPDARAYDLSPGWLAQAGAAAALPWIAGLDLAAVRDHAVGLADALLAALGLPPRGSAIVSIAGEGVAERLAEAGIRCALRAGRARLAFHLYSDENDLDRAISALTRGNGQISESI
ncbi:aminotransferase class V-fold PLP-dependent enzyme [Actinokineospora sp. UTMC 2448]|uniref:aminotransferase class V-fold PLP-dependent enzyme n=1 Tax=Actinokineospora sp. UTMC 2448 TaxID=2268449 RepID=UPI002164DDCE|nr:aminotransferase class V-fold PLP-dependent enzyme [Actinokineospora sp. UTMC 2448]UVS81058.1 Pyridoxal-phosphate-dependent protein EgtE [Actinokineospora sp. UTMC 2448]